MMGKPTIIKGDEFYKKRDQLKKLQTDKVNWNIYYIDETTGEKWIQEYPDSELHGGGAPQLRNVAKFPWE